MNTKLTLTIEQNIIEKAKIFAKNTGRSLSDLVENYFKMITKEEIISEIEITPLVKSLKGSFHASTRLDYKKGLTKALSDKYM
jgi:hypothetical protein